MLLPVQLQLAKIRTQARLPLKWIQLQGYLGMGTWIYYPHTGLTGLLFLPQTAYSHCRPEPEYCKCAHCCNYTSTYQDE